MIREVLPILINGIEIPDIKFPPIPPIDSNKPPIDPKLPIDPNKLPIDPNKPPTTEPPKPPGDKDGDTKVITIVKVINKNKVVVRDNNDGTTKQIIIAGDRNTCTTQSESVHLTGKINPKGIRLLADFDPCKINDGSVTLNIPNTDNIKLAVLSVDKNSNNKQGVLITPIKIQNINNNQALFTIELDDGMTEKIQ